MSRPRYLFADTELYPLPCEGYVRVWVMLCKELNQNFEKLVFKDRLGYIVVATSLFGNFLELFLSIS